MNGLFNIKKQTQINESAVIEEEKYTKIIELLNKHKEYFDSYRTDLIKDFDNKINELKEENKKQNINIIEYIKKKNKEVLITIDNNAKRINVLSKKITQNNNNVSEKTLNNYDILLDEITKKNNTGLQRFNELSEKQNKEATHINKLSNKLYNLKRSLFKDVNKINPLNVNIQILDDLVIYIYEKKQIYTEDFRDMIRGLTIDRNHYKQLLKSLDEYNSGEIDKDDLKQEVLKIRTEIETPQSKKEKQTLRYNKTLLELKEDLEIMEERVNKLEGITPEEPEEEENHQEDDTAEETQPEVATEEQKGTKKEQIINHLSLEPDIAHQLKDIAEIIKSKASNTSKWLKELKKERCIKHTKNGWKFNKKNTENPKDFEK